MENQDFEIKDQEAEMNQESTATEESAAQEKPETSIDELQNQLKEVKDKYLRLFADFDNHRKHSARDRINTIQTATKDLMTELLPVLDDFERAMKAVEQSQDLQALKEGVSLIHHKLKLTLEQKGLREMDAMGETFDVSIHEAITEVPAPNESMKGKVIDQVEKGYKLHDKIIRYAKVVVGK